MEASPSCCSPLKRVRVLLKPPLDPEEPWVPTAKRHAKTPEGRGNAGNTLDAMWTEEGGMEKLKNHPGFAIPPSSRWRPCECMAGNERDFELEFGHVRFRLEPMLRKSHRRWFIDTMQILTPALGSLHLM